MAAISVTPSKIRPLNGATIRRRPAGAALNVGDAVYIDTNGKVQQAVANGTQAVVQARGIVVAVGIFGATAANTDDMVDIVVDGPVTGFSGMTPGGAVYVGTTAGKLDQTAPATTGQYKYVAGYAEDDTTIFVQGQMQVPAANP
jgi:hypothetical protein